MDQMGNVRLISCLISPSPLPRCSRRMLSHRRLQGDGGAGSVLPGLPQSAHISLPGFSSTSCSRNLFPSASSAMACVLSVQPHRGGVKPVREHPPPEPDRQTDRRTVRAGDHLSPPVWAGAAETELSVPTSRCLWLLWHLVSLTA